MKRKKLACVILPFLIIVSACTQSAAEPTAGPDFALTITAQALLLESLTQTARAITPPPVPTETPSFTSIPEFTATPNKVIVTVSANTNCRSGPGEDYSIEGALAVGQQAEVVGKSSATGYWIINNPNRPGLCWLWGEHAAITGNASDLQEYAIPPTVTSVASLAPVIDSVVVRSDLSSGSMIIYADVSFHDSDGDANFVDWQVVSISANNVSATIKDKSINPSPNQRKGSAFTGQWNCGGKTYEVALAVTLHDQAGHISNSMRVSFRCN